MISRFKNQSARAYNSTAFKLFFIGKQTNSNCKRYSVTYEFKPWKLIGNWYYCCNNTLNLKSWFNIHLCTLLMNTYFYSDHNHNKIQATSRKWFVYRWKMVCLPMKNNFKAVELYARADWFLNRDIMNSNKVQDSLSLFVIYSIISDGT